MAATTQDVLTHHLNCFCDIDGTMADYTADSRFFTPDGLLRGSKAIREFFVRWFEEFAKPGMSFEMLRQEVDGDTAYIVWKAETAETELQVAREGRERDPVGDACDADVQADREHRDGQQDD